MNDQNKSSEENKTLEYDDIEEARTSKYSSPADVCHDLGKSTSDFLESDLILINQHYRPADRKHKEIFFEKNENFQKIKNLQNKRHANKTRINHSLNNKNLIKNKRLINPSISNAKRCNFFDSHKTKIDKRVKKYRNPNKSRQCNEVFNKKNKKIDEDNQDCENSYSKFYKNSFNFINESIDLSLVEYFENNELQKLTDELSFAESKETILAAINLLEGRLINCYHLLRNIIFKKQFGMFACYIIARFYEILGINNLSLKYYCIFINKSDVKGIAMLRIAFILRDIGSFSLSERIFKILYNINSNSTDRRKLLLQMAYIDCLKDDLE
ncbi:hypothetical protein DMUE_0538 [Dictyocoela muelleri]|nr:hypothetical protein DMUE_0538 [Dictyocoela muelleri]